MVKVAITGGSGFLAAHLIRHLQTNPGSIVEIRTIDRKPFRSVIGPPPSADVPPALVHHCCDLLDSAKLEQALDGVDVVFHLARKSFDYIFSVDQKATNERYSRDNLEATKCLLDAMFKCSVPRLVHVGDAYANMAPSDNFGNSEDVNSSLPNRFLLGHYGETRAKAELLGRERSGKEMANGQKFHALFLRPTFVYGEGERKLPMALHKVAQKHGGIVCDLAGPSNGMLQYIYAGNLAEIMTEAMDVLMSERAEQYSGTFFYCMDDTMSTKFGEFCSPLVRALGHQMGPSRSHWPVVLKQYLEESIRRLGGWEPEEADFSANALQFLFGFAIGFTNRKMALILKYRPNLAERERWMERTVEWVRREMEVEVKGQGGTRETAEKHEESERASQEMRRSG